MDNCKSIANFFNLSPKRQGFLTENIKTHLPGSNHFVLTDVCRTLCIEQLDGIDRTLELYVPIMKTVEGIQMNVSPQSGDKWNKKTSYIGCWIAQKVRGL